MREAHLPDILGGVVEPRPAVRRRLEAAGPLLGISCGSPLTLNTHPRKLKVLVDAAAAP